MSLIKCPDCDRMVSSEALMCFSCGRPIDSAGSSGKKLVKKDDDAEEKPAKKSAIYRFMIGFIAMFLINRGIGALLGGSRRRRRYY